ncbi:MAG: cytochrome c3 family protein, partial [Planctomycetes bacterium]|nr:cytochrome c3 family protein [Planctomycetota bacterium]
TDKKKTVVFKNGGTYFPENDDKSCDVACHTGYKPKWGGSVLESVTCKACHGVNGEDVDDFAAFNGVRAKINLNEWSTTGHGRPAASGSYASGNPPAAFPQNGCWYCHDSNVLHQVEDRPFRLIQHDQFSQRFEKECVFCHMTEADSECLGCHNIAESLAPQIDTIYEDSSVINPPYAQFQPDHSTYNGSGTIDGKAGCVEFCHVDDGTRHHTDSGVWSPDQKADVKNSYLQMGVCLKCHDDDNKSADGSYSQCYVCHVRPADNPATPEEDESMRYELGFDPGLPGTTRITPQKAKAASFHFGHKHYADYVGSLAVDTVIGTVSDTLAARNKIVDSSMNWPANKWYGYYVEMDGGPNHGLIRKIVSNTADTLVVSPDFPVPVQASNYYQIIVEGGTVDEIPATAKEIKDSSKAWSNGQWTGYLVEMNQGPQFAAGTVSETALVGTELKDSALVWVGGQWKGYSLRMLNGANVGEVREISGNTVDTLLLESSLGSPVQIGDSYEIIRVDRRRITGNSADTLNVSTDFSYPVDLGHSYTIVMPNWSGGKFCWDCHDPHGDQNLYMIQDKVATRTDGWVGRPVSRADVSFTTTQNLGMSYARINEPYDGICNVCHTEEGQHYGNDHGDGHMSGRICTECHEHRFTESHAAQQPCDECHGNRPVPRHSGFSQPRDCTKCHDGAIGNRMNVMGQFNARSHHVQGVEVANTHCYACHWESDEHGLINREHHQGYNNKEFSGEPNREVDLVIWDSTTRPTEYILGVTATQFTASNMPLSVVSERAEVDKITPHCLGCHSDLNNDTEPFGDCKTPRQYSWDGSSIADRYEDTSTTTWGKYTSTAGAAQKNITKAFSAHGNAVNNGGGYSGTTGVDEAIPNTRAGQSHNVQCFDCHNSHGSKVVGITSSYISFNGDQNGANLKETQAGKGGYTTSYMASSYTNPQSVNYYEAGAGQCFDCHETEIAGAKPWGYNSTFDADAPIMGYSDTMRFGQGVRGVASRYPFKSSTIMGGHMKPSSSISTAPKRQINGLCSPCHDPHGVSKSLGEDRAYGVPLLKGTWMTSPYKEDAPVDGLPTGRRMNLVGYRYYDRNLPREPGPEVTPYVYTDQKTFGADRVKETDQTFAGLCLSCHPKDTLTNSVNNDTAW